MSSCKHVAGAQQSCVLSFHATVTEGEVNGSLKILRCFDLDISVIICEFCGFQDFPSLLKQESRRQSSSRLVILISRGVSEDDMRDWDVVNS